METINTISQASNATLKLYDVVKVSSDYDVREALHSNVFNESGAELDVEFIGAFAIVHKANPSTLDVFKTNDGQFMTLSIQI